MPLDAGSAGAIAAAIGVPLTLAALARVFPAPPLPASTAPLEVLKARYRGWELGLGVLGLLLAVPAGFACWFGLRGLAALHASLGPPSELAWFAGEFYWALPAMFLCILATIPASDLAARALLRDRHGEYLAYLQAKARFDLARVSRFLVVVVSAGCAVFVLLGLDWSVRLGADGLTLNRYFSVGAEQRAWREVTAIRTAPALVAPNGRLVRRREYVLRFSDGRTWSTNSLLAEPSSEEKRRFVDVVSERSGVAVEEVEVLRNDEL
jgi:hypothetical protein